PVLHWISFSMPFVHPLASTPSVTTSPPSLLAIDGFERILKRWNGRPQVNAYIEAELKTLLVAFFEQSENQGTAPDSSPGSGLAEVRQLIHWLENNYQDPNALTRISEECQLNPDYFRRLFKRETGVTPGGYLKRLRMQSARYYLHDTPLRIQEIAQRVGMEDQRYFSKQYRSFWGKSPSDERIFE
ncbi:MAG: AraC family transcriptional regulator, partial [Kiritimatiellia bacterium]